jgi:RNA polymerase sigma-70 factor (ECF subfamily)
VRFDARVTSADGGGRTIDGAVSDASDTVLFERVRTGDPEALTVLMDRFAARLHRVALGITGQPSDAEEVVQDVFLALFRKADTFEGRAAPGSWLYRIAVNLALNKRRDTRTHREESLDAHLPRYDDGGRRQGERAYLLADWSRLPDAVLLADEHRATLRAAMNRLPLDYCAVLILRDVEELSSEETARVLGDSVPSVKSRLHRARLALREQLTRARRGPVAAGPSRDYSAAILFPGGFPCASTMTLALPSRRSRGARPAAAS